nr:DUF6702 family protein [Pedobacter sp. ASV19]
MPVKLLERKHPLHLSSMELNYTTKGATVEISCRLFTDDLENALNKVFKVHADLSSAAKHAEMDGLVKKYAARHLQLKTGSKLIGLNYLGFEKDNEAIVLYIESVPVKGLKDLEILNTLMYDLFDDQSNIMHITYNGNRKSTKLDYPDKLYKVVF